MCIMISDKLKELRTERNITQKEIADFLECSPNVYSRYEIGTRNPSYEALIKIADFYNVSIDYLLEHKVSEHNSLSDKEFEFIKQYRKADDRARQDALLILKKHSL